MGNQLSDSPEFCLDGGGSENDLPQVGYPMGLMSYAGILYVTDAGNHRILRVADLSAPKHDVCMGGLGKGRKLNQLMRPTGITINDGALFVLDAGNCRILRDMPDAPQAELYFGGTSRGGGPHQLLDPCGITSHGGWIYVSDFGNHRVLRLRSSLAGVSTEVECCLGGSRGAAFDQLAGPAACIIHEDMLYVADFWNHRILRTAVASTGADSRVECVFGGRGRGDGLHQLYGPRDIAFHKGYLYIVDYGNNRVLRVWPGADVAAVCLGKGSRGSRAIDLSRPRGIAFHEGRMCVADSDNHRVVVVSAG